jgi:GNAT superfamily N-acetyltransferase
MTDLASARCALRTNAENLALGHDVFVAAGARFVRNAAFPQIRDANHISDVTASAPAEIDALLARAEREFAGCPHRQYHLDFTTPPTFEARLQLEGYERSESLVMLLEGALAGTPPPFVVRPVATGDDWRAFGALAVLDWAEYRERHGLPVEPGVGEEMSAARRAKCPPLTYWLADIDGVPRGYFSSWAGVDGHGQVEDLFVQQEYRHRGLATALLHRTVAHCREQGAHSVVIVADPTDTPKRMYAAMGWRPVAVKREYRRIVGT